MKRALYWLGVGAAAAAAVLALIGADSRTLNPTSSIGLAIAGWVFLRASESAPR